MEHISNILKKYINKMDVDKERKEEMLKACKKEQDKNKDNKIK